MEVENLYGCFLTCSGVSTDTRASLENLMFFGLKGENFDGSRFAAAAIDKGACYAVISDRDVFSELSSQPEYADKVILVDDTLKALQQLAAFHRARFSIPVIGVTGTNGKTTTKELLTAVLSKKYNVLSTQGNLNNHIGVPLTLLRLRPEHEMAVVEMGASAPGEIADSCSMVKPGYGIVTNVGKAHLAGFGSFDGVKRTKGELYDAVKACGGTVFYNADDRDLVGMLAERDMLGVGYGKDSARIIRREDGSPYLSLLLQDGDEVDTRLVGDYNMNNVLAAVAIGKFFHVPEKDIYAAISAYVPSNNRSQFYQGASNRIVIDAYNANPTSMAASVENFARLKGERKVLILGDMRELGKDSIDEHKKILLSLNVKDYFLCFFVGKEFIGASAALGVDSDPKMLFFEDSDQLASFLKVNPLRNTYILVKGSRGIRLEKVFDLIES